MQISNAASSPALTQAGQTGATTSNTPTVPASQDGSRATTLKASPRPTQDEAVSISPAATAALSEDSRNTAAGASSKQADSSRDSNASHRANLRTTDTDATDAADAADIDADGDIDADPDIDASADTDTNAAADAETTDSASESAGANDSGDDSNDPSGDNISPLKSFAYGTLGLERPDQTQQETSSFYTAGRWLAAGVTIGGLISLLA